MPSLARPVTETWSDICPAKINLRLAVTGRRADGYHDLISLVARISLADGLSMSWSPGEAADSLEVAGGEVPADENNLVLRAIRSFRKQVPFAGRIQARLEKRIPIGAGLGGGSSDAAAALRGLQTLWNDPLNEEELRGLAVGLGADVPFFLGPTPAVMRGIGEQLEPVPGWREALAAWRPVVFCPGFGISTPWAYQELAKAGAYSDAHEENRRFASWQKDGFAVGPLLANGFRGMVQTRYPTFAVLLETLNLLPGVHAEMSGSGSACFALCAHPEAVASVEREVVRAWGGKAFRVEARFS